MVQTMQEQYFNGFGYSDRLKCLVKPDGSKVSLRAQSLSVFTLLAAHADSVVCKEEIFNSVWASVQVTDDSLTKCIADLRRALDDKEHTVLKTVRGQGYMLVVDAQASEHQQLSISGLEDPSVAAIQPTTAASRVQRVYKRRNWIWLISLLVPFGILLERFQGFRNGDVSPVPPEDVTQLKSFDSVELLRWLHRREAML